MANKPASELPLDDTTLRSTNGFTTTEDVPKETGFVSEKKTPSTTPSLDSGADEEKIEQVAEEDGLPVIVREIVSLEDHPEDVNITFRYQHHSYRKCH